MLHWFVVGHFDPADPVDLTQSPYQPKVLRPIARNAAEQTLNQFGSGISTRTQLRRGRVRRLWMGPEHHNDFRTARSS